MKKFLILLFGILMFTSCELIDFLDQDNFNHFGYDIIFNIKNSSGSDITDLKIYLTYDTNISIKESLIVNQASKSLNLNMTNAIKVDGSYTISYKIGAISYEKNIGYYTNGFPLEEKLNLEIANGEVILK